MAGRDAILAVEQQLVDDLEAITDAQTRALVEAWALAWSEISADLIDALSEVMANGTKVTASAVVRSTRLAQQLAVVADRLDDLAAEAGVTITRDLRDVVDQGVDGQIALIGAQLDEDDDRREQLRRRSPARALEAMVDRISEQITSQTLPLGDETYEAVQRELVRGVAVGSNPRETARRMVDRAEDRWNFGLTRALTISRTELLDASREAAAAEQAEHADVLAGWLWLAHLGPHTCRSCLGMHGQLFPLDKRGPDDHQQGRCSRCPVVKGLDGEPDLSWVPDADEHFASLDRKDQIAILGREGYKAWAAGDFPRERWTKTRSSDGWRDSQVPASPGDPGAGSTGSGSGGGPAGSGGGGTSDDEPRSIRESLDVQSEELEDVVGLVADAIDRVHLVPAGTQRIEIAHMEPAFQAALGGPLGLYMHLPNQTPQLMVQDPTPDNIAFVLAHEFGHALDDLVLGPGTGSPDMLTKNDLTGELAEWWAAVQATQAYRWLQQMATWDDTTDGAWARVMLPAGGVVEWNPDRDYVEYLLKPQELFGRAYCQWIATESGDLTLLAGIAQQVGLPQGFTVVGDRPPRHPLQWEDDDFEAVVEALRRLFEARGLLEALDGD